MGGGSASGNRRSRSLSSLALGPWKTFFLNKIWPNLRLDVPLAPQKMVTLFFGQNPKFCQTFIHLFPNELAKLGEHDCCLGLLSKIWSKSAVSSLAKMPNKHSLRLHNQSTRSVYARLSIVHKLVLRSCWQLSPKLKSSCEVVRSGLAKT